MYNLSAETEKSEIFKLTASFIEEKGFKVIDKDDVKPWGGYFVIDEEQAPEFISTFFSHLSLSDFEGYGKLSPKVLVVAPNKRLSWQYHHRRAEIWKVIGGNAGVVVSDTDEETEVKILQNGEVISLKQGERHRLVGLQEWGIIAEIWQHTDPANPSDENDIVRVQDDFGR